jgi:hypothetical protein
MRTVRGLVTPAMLVAFAVFGTMPLWVRPVGLYDYLGVEILIFHRRGAQPPSETSPGVARAEPALGAPSE